MRREDWPERLVETVEAHRTTPFSWGKNDCATFTAACVESITGLDHMAEFHGLYSSEEQAAELLGEGGISAVLLRLGFNAVPVARAGRGDIVGKHNGGEDWLALGVCLGATSAFVGRKGLEMISTQSCEAAWEVI